MPRWLFRVMPYAYVILTSSMRVSNAKAKRDLGCAPSAPTYGKGMRRTLEALEALRGDLLRAGQQEGQDRS